MSLLTKFIAAYFRSGLRGSTRFTDLVSTRFPSLRSVPIEVEGGTLIADLRIASSRGILADPRCHSGEDRVMHKYVRPGDSVFDIGAHLGFYTLLLAKLTGPEGLVFAFEPNPELLPSLRKTVAQISNIMLLETALSDSIGKMDLFVPEDPSMASLSNWTDGIAGKVHSVSCDMTSLDHLVESGRLSQPSFVKCDVEGAELMIFRGGRSMLDCKDAPVILFEVNEMAANAFGFQVEEYFGFLESLSQPNYRFFEVTADGIGELRSRQMKYANVLAVPEKLAGNE